MRTNPRRNVVTSVKLLLRIQDGLELKLVQGVLVECDPSIKAIILKIDQENHDYIIEDLDDQTLVVREPQLQKLKAKLEQVGAQTKFLLGIIHHIIWH